MADKRGKRKAWVYDKEAKIPRSTAWRSKTREKGNVDSSSASDSMVTSLDIEGASLSSCSVSGHAACFNDFESAHNDHSSSQPPTSPTNSDHIIETLCHDQTNGNSANPAVDEFLSFIVDSDSDASGNEYESSDSEFDSKHEDETGDVIEDLQTNPEEISDDSVPLYSGANVSRLGAMILVMLFSLRHQLSGQALIDLVKVLRTLLPDSHKFVSSAYLLMKYFADFFGEPAPKKHSYCGNCHGRIRKGQAECLKEKCWNSKKKIEHFLELDLHTRLCQLYRGKLKQN